jgi:hypothetical protein
MDSIPESISDDESVPPECAPSAKGTQRGARETAQTILAAIFHYKFAEGQQVKNACFKSARALAIQLEVAVQDIYPIWSIQLEAAVQDSSKVKNLDALLEVATEISQEE